LNPITNLIHDVPFGWKWAFRVESIAFSGNLMAAGYRLGEIKIWDTNTWAELASWHAHPSVVSGLDFSPDGKLLASGGSDCQIQLWDLATVFSGMKTATITPQISLQGHSDKIASVTFAPNGRSIVSCGTDGTVKLWSLPPPDRPIPLFAAKPANDKLDLWFLEDGKHAVYCDQNWQFFRADLSGATAPQLLEGPKAPKHSIGQESMAVSPDGKTLAFRYVAGNFADGPVQLWNLETGELRRTLRPSRIAFVPGGLLISAGGGEIRIEDLSSESGESLLTTPIKADGDPMTLSGDGRVLAARLSRTQIGFWNLPDGHSMGTIDVPAGGAETFALSYDGRQLAYCCWPENSPVLWDLTSHQPRTIPMNHVTSTWGHMAFAPDGKTLVLVDSEETAIFWNLATGREIVMEENLAGTPWTPKFSANGEYLALPLTLRRAPPIAEIEAKERARAQERLAAAKEAGK
jgi:WD40 repeat protein